MLNWFLHLSDWCVVQIVALRSLSSVWVRRWVLRLLACLNDLLQSVQEWGFSPTCDPTDHQPDRMICCNSYTCAASLHCGQACDFSDHQPNRMICFSPVSSEFQHHWIICCICYICVASLQCGWACVFSDFQLDWMICCKWYTYVAFLQCVSSCVSSELQLDWMMCRTVHKCAALSHMDDHVCTSLYFFSPLWINKCCFRIPARPNDLKQCVQECS